MKKALVDQNCELFPLHFGEDMSTQTAHIRRCNVIFILDHHKYIAFHFETSYFAHLNIGIQRDFLILHIHCRNVMFTADRCQTQTAHIRHNDVGAMSAHSLLGYIEVVCLLANWRLNTHSSPSVY